MSQVLILRTIVADSTVKSEISTAMSSAADKLASEIEDLGADLISFALAAFNPKLSETSQQLARAEELLYEAEVSIASLHKDKPVTLIRATMVLALYKLLNKPSVAAMLYLTLVDYFDFLADKNESTLRDDFIQRAQVIYLSEAESAWQPKSTASAIKKTALIKAVLTEDVNESVQKALNEAVSNGHYLVQQGYYIYEGWANIFTAKATEAISIGMDAVLAASNLAFSNVLTNVEKKVSEIQIADAQIKFLERQSRILWWLQVKYCVGLKTSYRDLGVKHATVQMAIDFKRLVPVPVPPYVEAVLVEAMRSTHSEAELELLNTIKDITWPGSELYPSLTLLSKLGTKDTAKAFEQQTGLSAKTKLTPSQLARWLFRQMQAKAMT